jgi:hypothetical protein
MTALQAFSRSLDSLFRRLGMTATFQPALGSALEVVVIPKRPEQIVGLGDIGAVTEATFFDLRVAEVAEPKTGDVIEYDGTQYRIIGEPRRDMHGLVWAVEAEAL